MNIVSLFFFNILSKVLRSELVSVKYSNLSVQCILLKHFFFKKKDDSTSKNAMKKKIKK